jgi:hypothetical protein
MGDRIIETNEDALERSIAALEGLTDAHAAIVEQARTLARSIDTGNENVDSKMHGEYRQVLKVLFEVGKKQGLDDFAKLLLELRGAENPAKT